MDAIDSVVDPLRDFAKDSIRLVKRCHKPDRKDSYDACERSVCFLTSDLLDLSACCEDLVHESGGPYSDRVCSNGIRGVLCEAHLHSHQQHHRRCHLDAQKEETFC
ncbi:hypothetical protein IGI04_013156 [Brassica rapa subsp. trilocularis]|uniref:Uncharacterized protein n=1 Tax=Brassica rapa subsp. trilocularis TaxID=1813537 RepID=A0ABQ7N818_BRACM|nr:hypothetical protein IGI04_013156 [Brassica rapa subsp. trilocularis]